MFLGTGVTNEGLRVGGLFRLGRVCVDNAVGDALGTPDLVAKSAGMFFEYGSTSVSF